MVFVIIFAIAITILIAAKIIEITYKNLSNNNPNSDQTNPYTANEVKDGLKKGLKRDKIPFDNGRGVNVDLIIKNYGRNIPVLIDNVSIRFLAGISLFQ